LAIFFGLQSFSSRGVELPDPATPAEMSEIYASFCLDRFPDDHAVDALAANRKALSLRPDEVQRYLKADPGRGWYLSAPTGTYVITIEAPPFHTCAVRRMTPNGIAGVLPYIAAVKAYVAGKGGKLVGIPPNQSKTPNGIADISTYGYGMFDPQGKPSDTFAVILTNYHGHVPAEWQTAAKTGVGVEIRMVHQLLAPQPSPR
jgi:hypothetical protein